MWGGLYTVVCTCAHRVLWAEQVFGDTDGETDGLCCRCGGPGLLRAQEGQSKRSEDRQMCGEWRSLLEEVGQPKGHVAPTLHYYLDIAIVCCWAVCGLSTCAIYRQGSTWTNTAPTRFNVGLLVEAGDGGGGALVPGSGSWTLFLFFSALWGKATSR